MTRTIESRSREQIAGFLPDAIAKALTSYHTFATRDVSAEKPKEFSEHHSACKVAVAHIELLLKLARWAELPQGAEPDKQAMLTALMQEAEKELSDFRAVGEG